MPARILQGVVTSSKSKNTVSVLVERKFRHPIYQKTVTFSKKYQVHNDSDTIAEGEVVKIIECRPISKTKKWKIHKE